ncbi:unnamed protein product [Camellia sinensis]
MLALPRYSPFSAPYPPSASPSASPFLLLQHRRRCHISDQASAPLALLRVFDQPPLFCIEFSLSLSLNLCICFPLLLFRTYQHLHYHFLGTSNLPVSQNPIAVPSRRPHGLTRGLKVQAIVEKDGKLKVLIPHEYRAPVGDHASQLVSRIGIEVRTRLQASWSFLRNKVSKDNLGERASHEHVDCFSVSLSCFIFSFFSCWLV